MYNIRKKDAIINKVKRASIVLYIRKFLPIVIIVFLIGMSFLLGFWNVREFEYDTDRLVNVTRSELDSYVREYLGRNIFSISPSQIEKDILESNGYINRVNVKKVLPDKLRVDIQEYIPYYSGYSSDSCLIFSKEGVLLAEICTECKQECFVQVDTLSNVYISSDSVIENNGRLIFYEEVSSIIDILDNIIRG